MKRNRKILNIAEIFLFILIVIFIVINIVQKPIISKTAANKINNVSNTAASDNSAQTKTTSNSNSTSNNTSSEQNPPATVETPKDNNKPREFTEGNLKHNDKGLRIFMYHSIDYEKGNELRIPKEQFREQMKYLKDNGYTTLTLAEAYAFFTENKPVPVKSVVLTFDDGYVDNYTNAFPVLKEFGLKGTVFMITDLVDKYPAYLNSEQLKEMDKYGFDVESHTVNHDPPLNELTYDQQLQTIKDSKAFLEKTLNKKVNFFAYPYGKWNENSIKALKECGYSMAVTTAGEIANKSNGIFTLDRTYISANYNLQDFIKRLSVPD